MATLIPNIILLNAMARYDNYSVSLFNYHIGHIGGDYGTERTAEE